MGGNGSFASGSTDSELGRAWKTIATVEEIQIVTPKNPKASVKLPEESQTPDRMYATFYSDGHDVKAIAQYGSDGKKIWEIHTVDHKGLGAHYHTWKDGHPEGEPASITSEMKQILDILRNFN